ncbi:MAG TPA: hypothetical protein VEC57_07830 [Candidatus Limnocylindrales bacterium]|nr:hypothetical protein [Candidatus Limnocylindrales bacterium]
MGLQRKGEPRALRALPRLAVAAALILSMSGCSAAKETAEMPGLRDLRPTGPAGRNCYDSCSVKHMACVDMCPHASADCTDECYAHAKYCLADCPELGPAR